MRFPLFKKGVALLLSTTVLATAQDFHAPRRETCSHPSFGYVGMNTVALELRPANFRNPEAHAKQVRLWAREGAILLGGTVLAVTLSHFYANVVDTWSQAGRWQTFVALQPLGIISGPWSVYAAHRVATRLFGEKDPTLGRRTVKQLLWQMFYFTGVEGLLIYYLWMKAIPSYAAQLAADQLLISPLLLLPINLLTALGIDGLSPRQAETALREKLVAFYALEFLIWLPTISVLLLQKNALPRFWVLTTGTILSTIITFLVARLPVAQTLHHRILRWLLKWRGFVTYVRVARVALWIDFLAALLFPVQAPVLFWIPLAVGLAFFPARAFYQFWARRRVEEEMQALRELVNEARLWKDFGETFMDLIVRLREPLEYHYQRLNYWTNRTGSPTLWQDYVSTMREIVGAGSERITDAEFMNADFPRLVHDYLARASDEPAQRLSTLLALHLKPTTQLPVLEEHPRYGIQQEVYGWRLNHGAPALATEEIHPTCVGLKLPGAMTVRLLWDDDRRVLKEWLETPRQSEVVYDLEHFLTTGLVRGEYGYALINDHDGAIEGFVLLFNGETLHLHIVYTNPYRVPIRGVGRALIGLALRDAWAQKKILTTYPINPESLRLFYSLMFKRLAAYGSCVTERFALAPKDMPAVLDQINHASTLQLPPASTFRVMDVLRTDAEQSVTLEGIPFAFLEPMFYSTPIEQRFLGNPQALMKTLIAYEEHYWQRSGHAQTFHILDLSRTDPQTYDVVSAADFRAQYRATPAPVATTPKAPGIKPVTIRAARPSDLPPLWLFRDAYYVSKTTLGTLIAPEDLMTLIVQGQWPGVVLIALDSNEQIVGYALSYANLQGRYAEIEEIATNPAWQGQGLATRLVNDSVAELEGFPLQQILMEDESILGQAARIGRRFGFHEHPGVENLYIRRINGFHGDEQVLPWTQRLSRFGFSRLDPRFFASELVPKLLARATGFYTPKNQTKAGEVFLYLRKYRPLDIRLWLAWVWHQLSGRIGGSPDGTKVSA